MTSCGLVDKKGFGEKMVPPFFYFWIVLRPEFLISFFLSFTLTQQSLFDDPRFKLSNKESEIFSALYCALYADITDYIE